MQYKAVAGKTAVLLHGRTSDGQRVSVTVNGTEPYFYVPTGAVESGRDVVRVDKAAGKAFIGDQVLDRVVVQFPFSVPRLRDSLTCPTWEADIVYENRIRYDYGIKGSVEVPGLVCEGKDIRPVEQWIEPRWCSLDIETFDRGSFHGPEDPRVPVVSVAIWDSFTDRWVVIFNGELTGEDRRKIKERFRHIWIDTVKGQKVYASWDVHLVEVHSEEDLFKTVCHWFEQVQPDIIAGWNLCGEKGFDIPYLKNRAQKIGADCPDWDQYTLFEAMRGYEFSTYDSIDSNSLQYVSTSHFGLPGKTTDKRIHEMMDRGRDELVEYNAFDTYLCAEVIKRSGILTFYLRLAERAGTSLEDTFLTGRLVDAMVFHHLQGKRIYQPTKVAKETDGVKIGGAEVFDPFTGVAENVFEGDNKSEYPMIMRTFNISPETILDGRFTEEQIAAIPHVTLASGHRYRTDIKGVYPELVEIIDRDRDKARATGDKVGDGVNKKLANTFFGMAPSEYNRNGDKRVGGDITGMAQEHLRWNRDFSITWKHPARILYGDTDSQYGMFLDNPRFEEASRRAKALMVDMNATFAAFAAKFGQTDPSKVVLAVKLEHIYERFIQAGTKKKYAGIYRSDKGSLEHNGVRYEIKVRGFEIRKANAAQLTKRAQESTLKMMLFGADRAAVIKHVNSFAALAEGPDVGIPEVVSRKAQVLRAVEFSNAFLGTQFRKGDHPALFFGSVRGHPRTDCFAWEWGKALPDGVELDQKKTLERVLLSPLEGVLDLLAIRPSDCLTPSMEIEEWV